MNTLTRSAPALALLLVAPVLAGERVLLDSAWRFHHGQADGASDQEYDDSQWRAVDLPHDWSIDRAPQPDAPSAGGGGFFPTGVGWYRRTFDAPSDWRGRSLRLDFEGVYHDAQVWLNGQQLGEHAYGYTPFSFDVSDIIQLGEENVLAVRVDNSNQPNSRWYSGSGIYRHVWMHVARPLHVAQHGVIVRTEETSAESATVNVSVTVRNDSNAPLDASVTFECNAPGGEPETPPAQPVSIDAQGEATVTFALDLENPALWTPTEPRLHTLVVGVRMNDEVVDETTTTFGVRTISVDAERGILLNGEPIEMFGGNLHHDNGPLGAAAYDRAEERRVEILKRAGFNAIRTSHNPPSPALLDACDRLGMLVIDEAFDGWAKPKTEHDYSRVFEEKWREDLAAMVLRDRNHPSVVMWSIGNEMYERGDPETPALAREMVAHVKSLDRTRPVTAGVNGLGRDEAWPRLDPLFAELDAAGYNYEAGRFDNDHQRVPTRVMYASESYVTNPFVSHLLVTHRPYVVGDFIWSAMDYLGEAGIGRVFPPGEEPRPHWIGSHFPWHGAACGDIDLIGVRKPISFYRSIVWDRGTKLYASVVPPAPGGGEWRPTAWAPPPGVPSWTWDGHEDRTLKLNVYSRWPEARVVLNGRVVGQQATNAENMYHVTFEVPYEPGELAVFGVDAFGTNAEQVILETAGPATQLSLSPDRAGVTADGQDLCFVSVEVRDPVGRRRPDASPPIQYTVDGPARLVAVGSADLTSREPYVANPRRAYQGRALAVLRTTDEPGTITLTAESAGLAGATATIESAPAPQESSP